VRAATRKSGYERIIQRLANLNKFHFWENARI